MENPQAMPNMDQQQQPQGGGQDQQMQQIMAAVQDMLQQGAQPADVAAELLNSQVPPDVIMEVFVEMGMPEEEAQTTIQDAMNGGQQQQGAGEEMMEGQASNPQEEQMEGAASGEQAPSEEEIAMMQEAQPSDEELAMAFGGPNYNLIEKAFGGTAELNVNSDSYVQDRQANFINALKRNTMMNQATKEIYGQDPLKMKFGGDLPKADLGDIGKYKTKDEYELAIHRYNADPNNKTKLDFNTEIGKWKEPAQPTTVTGQDPRYHIIYNYAPPSAYGPSALSRVYNNSERGPGRVKINGKNVPANFNYSDLFDPGKGTGTVDGRTWTATEAEDIRGGIFNRKSVGKRYKINWDTPATNATLTGNNTVPGAVPGAVPGSVPGTQNVITKQVGNQTLRFDAMGNPLQASKYNPNNFITADQAKEEEVNYQKYQDDINNKTYDPATGKFVNVNKTRDTRTGDWVNGTEYSQTNPMRKEDLQAIQATLGLPETGVWDDALTTKIRDFQKANNLKVDGTIGTNTGKALAQNYATNKAIHQVSVENPNANLSQQYGMFTQKNTNDKINTAVTDAEKASKAKLESERQATLDKATQAWEDQHGGLYDFFHKNPQEKYDKQQEKLKEKNAEVERLKLIQKSDAFTGRETDVKSFGGVSTDALQKAAQTIMMAFGGNMRTFSEAGSTDGEGDSYIDVYNKKGKLKVDWNAVTDLTKEKMDWSTKFFREAEQRKQDREREGLYSAVNAPQNELENQGYDQFGNFMGATNNTADIQNLTNTSQSMNQQVYELGGKVYSLGGQYDLTDDEVEVLKSHGINIQRS